MFAAPVCDLTDQYLGFKLLEWLLFSTLTNPPHTPNFNNCVLIFRNIEILALKIEFKKCNSKTENLASRKEGEM